MKVTAEKLKRSFYVDNCITSEETEDELRKFVEEAKKLMISAKFELRRWISAPFHLEPKETWQETVRILGLLWDIDADEIY
jgi:hypothetical protein